MPPILASLYDVATAVTIGGSALGWVSGRSGRLQNVGIAVVLVAATLAIYAQTYRFGSVNFDDPEYLASNIHLESGLSIEGLRWAFTTPAILNYIPLTLVSHMLDRTLFGDDLGGAHLMSVALHALNSILLFGALYSMTRARWRSAAVAILFAIHPLNVESVAWISERKSVLSTTFWILSVWAYAGYARRPGVTRYLGVALLLALGLLAKPMLVTLPLVLLLLDYWPLERISFRRSPATEPTASCAKRPIGRLIAEKLPLLAISAAASIVTLHAQERWIGGADLLSFQERTANAVVAYARYLGKIVWPTDLAMHYPHPYLPRIGGIPLEAWQVVAASALLLSLTILAVAAVRRRYFAVGWLWFLGTLVPTIGLVQVGHQAIADRYAYVPAIGLFLAMCWAAFDAAEKLRASRPVATRALQAAAVAGIAALAVAASHQVGYWRDSISLFERTLAVIPNNPKIRYDLANEYRAQGDLDAAIRSYQIALETDPDSVRILTNLAGTLNSKGDYDAAIDACNAALGLSPHFARAHNNLGVALQLKGEREAAIASFRRAVESAPGMPDARGNLANALSENGEFEEAVDHFLAAVEGRSSARTADAFVGLGSAYFKLGRLHEAEAAYQRAIQDDSRNPHAQSNLGVTLARQGKFAEAIDHYRLAIAASPDFAAAHNNLGEALGAQGRIAEAIEAFEEALRADPSFERAAWNLENARMLLNRLDAPPSI